MSPPRERSLCHAPVTVWEKEVGGAAKAHGLCRLEDGHEGEHEAVVVEPRVVRWSS